MASHLFAHDSVHEAPPASSHEQQRADAEVSALDADIRRLTERKRAILVARNNVSPVNRLPDECISIVFRWAQQTELVIASMTDKWTYPGCHEKYQGKTALAASQVCSRWRSIALATSGLWAKLSVVLGKIPRSLDRQVLYRQMLCQHLDRGATAFRLDLDIQFFPDDPARYFDHHPISPKIASDIDTLVPYLGKSRRLCIHIPESRNVRKHLSHELINHMPNLECLLLIGGDMDLLLIPMPFVGPQFNSLTLDSANVPNIRADVLRNLSILRATRSSLAVIPGDLDPSDEEIKNMRDAWRDDREAEDAVENVDGAIHLDLIQSCTGLRILELWELSMVTPNMPETVELPNLTVLGLSMAVPYNVDPQDERPSPMETFFRYVTMPALRSCTLDLSVSYSRPQDPDSVLRALVDARPALTELTLRSFASRRPEPYLELFSMLHSLEKFSLIRCALPDDIFKELEPKPEGTLLPNLYSLSVHDFSTTRWEQFPRFQKRFLPRLRQLVQSRFESTTVKTLDELEVRMLTTPEVSAQDCQAMLEPWARKVDVHSSGTWTEDDAIAFEDDDTDTEPLPDVTDTEAETDSDEFLSEDENSTPTASNEGDSMGEGVTPSAEFGMVMAAHLLLYGDEEDEEDEEDDPSYVD